MAGLNYYLIGALLFLGVIVSSISAQGTVLTQNVPLIDHVDRQQYNYYSINIENPNPYSTPLTITVTSLSGDADLYVSKTNPTPRPGTGAGNGFDYSSGYGGDDSVSITSADLTHIYHVYIGVYGWLSTNYSIVYSFTDSVQLIPGYPANMVLQAHTMSYANITITPKPTNSDLVIRAALDFGYISLYIGTGTLPNRNVPSSYKW
jgi:hypothetical protein